MKNTEKNKHFITRDRIRNHNTALRNKTKKVRYRYRYRLTGICVWFDTQFFTGKERFYYLILSQYFLKLILDLR